MSPRMQGKQDEGVSVTGRSGIHPWPFRNSSHTFGLLVFLIWRHPGLVLSLNPWGTTC